MKSRSLQNKNYFFLVLALLILLVLSIYKYKITYTIALYSEMNQLKAQSVTLANSTERLESLKKMAGGLVPLDSGSIAPAELQQSLLASLTSIAQECSVSVVGISAGHSSGTASYRVTGYDVILNGGYTNIVHVIDLFSNNNKSFRIASVRFNSFLNRINKRNELKAALHIQYITHE